MTKVYIEVRDGNVLNAYSPSNDVKLVICDYDNAEAGDEYATRDCAFLERHLGEMNKIY